MTTMGMMGMMGMMPMMTKEGTIFHIHGKAPKGMGMMVELVYSSHPVVSVV